MQGGGGYSSDRGDRRILLGLKFSIPGYFGEVNLQVVFSVA